jgi:hypothetical protein
MRPHGGHQQVYHQVGHVGGWAQESIVLMKQQALLVDMEVDFVRQLKYDISIR